MTYFAVSFADSPYSLGNSMLMIDPACAPPETKIKDKTKATEAPRILICHLLKKQRPGFRGRADQPLAIWNR
jgi:hypothetical protein